MKKVLAMCAVLFTSACGQSHLPVETGVSLELAQHRAAILSKVNYTLLFEIPVNSSEDIPAHALIEFELSDNSEALQLDFRAREEFIHAVSTNGIDTAFQFKNEHIILPASALRTGNNTIDIAFTAGTSSLNRNPDYLYTLFVPDRARTAFPLFDQPDLKASYQLTLDVPAKWTALSNASVAAVTPGTERTLYRFEKTALISSYLFSFVAGKFETITQKRNGRSMTMLHRETDTDKVARNIDQIFDLHSQSLAWMEEYTGIDYPYQKLDFALIPSFQYGGMEHVGAIQYRASSLLLDESPSDDLVLRRASLIAHETAHMWFGNLVTMKWFNDVWTKEVFASFMAGKIINPGFPDIDHDLNFLTSHYPQAYAVDRTPGANPIRQPLPNLDNAGQMYGAIIYHKAPIMMRQLELLVGEQQLQDGLQEYLQNYAFGNATWPELIDILDTKTEADLGAWSNVWVNTPGRPERLIANPDGMGYGLHTVDIRKLENWSGLSPVEKGSLLIDLYENLLAGSLTDIETYYLALLDIIATEQDQLLMDLALNQASRIHHSFLPDKRRNAYQSQLEKTLWQAMLAQADDSGTKMLFDAFTFLAQTPSAVAKVHRVWSRELTIDRLALAETEYIWLAEILAIHQPENSKDIIAEQLAQINNPDNRRRLEFIAPSLSAETATRDAFFASLSQEKNRTTESWVLDALANLHHPNRIAHAEKYILPSLELLEEIQTTGDIFFPARWLSATLQNHHAIAVIETVEDFLAARPDYNSQLRMKILQAVDLPIRANAALAAASG
jgi:aminopeptidase N